jgi:hypothetical protein
VRWLPGWRGTTNFASINGSLVKVAENGVEQTKAINALTMAVQRLTDEFTASQKTLVATAAALKDAEAARRDKAAQVWSPVQKVIAVIGGVAALAAIVLAIVAARK